jgi:hypothetical protein
VEATSRPPPLHIRSKSGLSSQKVELHGDTASAVAVSAVFADDAGDEVYRVHAVTREGPRDTEKSYASIKSLNGELQKMFPALGKTIPLPPPGAPRKDVEE